MKEFPQVADKDGVTFHGGEPEALMRLLYPKDDPVEARPASRSRTIRGLFAEPDPEAGASTLRHLARHAPHIQLELLSSPEQVLDRLPRSSLEPCAYDVVLLDYAPHRAQALAILKVLRDERGLNIPVVLVADQDHEELAAGAMHLGVVACVSRHDGYWQELAAVLEGAINRAALLASEADLRLSAVVMENMREGVMVTDTGGVILAVNRAFTEMTGLPAEAVRGQPHSILSPIGLDCPMRAHLWTQLLAQGQWQGEIWNNGRGGEALPAWLDLQAVRDAEGRVERFVGVFTDLSQARRQEQALHRLSHHDVLTGLPNRLMIEERLRHGLEHAARQEQKLALLFMDLDNFRSVNDSLGHVIGDQLLRDSVARLQQRVRQEDTLGRFAGDKFLLLLESIGQPQEAAEVAQALLAGLAAPFPLPDGREVFLGATIGISVYPDDSDSVESLLRDAEAAMYRAKAQGRGSFCFAAGGMNADALARLELETSLRHALLRGELELYFQPKVNLSNGFVSGAEALLRWRRDEARMIPPAEFIPLAEATGLIIPIGAWVIDTACARLRAWSALGHTDMRLAVNVSARQFRSGDLEKTLAEALARHGIAPQRLELELTESMLMNDPAEAVTLLQRLKALGVGLSLDDFGTGYSSFTYLSRFPIDTLKIDQSFVGGMVTEPEAAGIVDAMVGLGRRLGLKLVAEGVETEAQLSSLGRLGCDEIQGYLFSRPLAEADFLALLGTGKRLAPQAGSGSAQGTLLLVDDEPGILSALRRMLRKEPYRILTAGGGQEALELLALESVQVVITDQRMPNMTGTELLRRIRDIHPNCVRMVLSGQADMPAVISAINDGAAFKFLSKPWDDDQLRERIREAFRMHAALSGTGAQGRAD